ncbi:hypothetical protein ACWDRB_58795 [Nonomuraea sp. NPDC003707]
MAVKRTQYWNLGTGTVRSGATGHGESLTDIESHLMPMDRLRNSGLHGWGVAAGLRVTATPGASSVTVSLGTALDAEGNLIVLTDGGVAVVDPVVDPDEVQNVPTVPVSATGVTVDSTDLTGAVLLTVTWREVAGFELLNAPVLLHAPWLRLVPAAGFPDVGDQVVLAEVTLGTGGIVDALGPGVRRQASTPTGRLELRRPRGDALGVDHCAVAELVAGADDRVDLNVLPPAGPPRRALSVFGTGAVQFSDDIIVTGHLRVRDHFTVEPTGAVNISGDLLVGDRLTVDTAGTVTIAGDLRIRDRLVVDTAGNVSIGGAKAARVLHVEGSEVHSGGPGGGFSFADRAVRTFVETPGAAERWVWYAHDGTARLWSGQDRLSIGAPGEGGGLDVYRRMRVRQGGDASAGIWLFQTGLQADRAFVGMLDDGHVGFWGNGGAGWGLRMDVATGSVDIGGPTRASLRVAGDAVVGGDMVIGGALATASTVRAGGGLTLLDGNVVSATTRLNVTGPGRMYMTVHWPDVPQYPDWSGGGIGTWDVFARGAVYVGTDPDHPRCQFLNDGTKRFAIDHPLDPGGRVLTHACVEGPEAAVYYRGEGRLSGGRARVTLPDYFEALACADGRTVLLTPVSDLDEPVCALAATPVADGGFTVLAADDRNPAQRFCWEVKAVRADVGPLVVETRKRPSSILMVEPA